MRALVATRHGGPEVLEMRDDHPEPVPGEHDVLVEVLTTVVAPRLSSSQLVPRVPAVQR